MTVGRIRSVLWHLSEPPLMVTPLLYYSCHKLLSSISPFHCFSALFLSRSLMLSLNHPFFLSLFLSIFPNHPLPYCSLSSQIFHSTHPSTSSVHCLPHFILLSLFTPRQPLSFPQSIWYSNDALCPRCLFLHQPE